MRGLATALSGINPPPAPTIAPPIHALEIFQRLDGLPDSYFVQLVRDDSNAPLMRAGEVIVADQGGPYAGGWYPVEGGLFVIEYRSALDEFRDQRCPRVSRAIVQTFRGDRGWYAGSLNRGVVGRRFFCVDGPYRDDDALAEKLIGKVMGIYCPTGSVQ